jgi:hypothetical protein
MRYGSRVRLLSRLWGRSERSPASSLMAGFGWSSPSPPACASGDRSASASKSTSPRIEVKASGRRIL